MPKPGNVQAHNRYSYGSNNPARYTDQTGHVPIDEIVDLVFIGIDLVSLAIDRVDIAINGESPESIAALAVDQAALAADVLCAAIPYGTGGGPALRLAQAGGVQAQAAVKVGQATRIAQTVTKGIQLARIARKASSGQTIQTDKNGRILNRKGEPYPQVHVEGYGEVPFPEGDLAPTDPSPLRNAFGTKQRQEFRSWWESKYGWKVTDEYQIHHIRPLSRGGTNDYSNLVPLKKGQEQHQLFNDWWSSYP